MTRLSSGMVLVGLTSRGGDGGDLGGGAGDGAGGVALAPVAV